MTRRPAQSFVLAVALVTALAGCDRLFRRGELPSLDAFEGELEVAARGSFANGVPQPAMITVHVRDDRLRFDAPGTGDTSAFLFDAPARRFFVINQARHQAIRFEMNDDGRAGLPPGVVVTRTGRRDKVAGFACEDWEVSLPDEKVETVCVADRRASFFRLPIAGGLPGMRGWMTQVFDGEHVPLRLVVSDRAKGETGRLELTRLSSSKQPPDLFSVPSGAQVIDLAELLRGKGAGRGTRGASQGGPAPEPEPVRIPARPSHS